MKFWAEKDLSDGTELHGVRKCADEMLILSPRTYMRSSRPGNRGRLMLHLPNPEDCSPNRHQDDFSRIKSIPCSSNLQLPHISAPYIYPIPYPSSSVQAFAAVELVPQCSFIFLHRPSPSQKSSNSLDEDSFLGGHSSRTTYTCTMGSKSQWPIIGSVGVVLITTSS